MASGTEIMYRVQQIATGVAGSPYYLTAYFDSTQGTAQAAATAWREAIGNAAANFVAPYTYQPISFVDLVDPVSGNTVGVETVSVPLIAFTASGDPLPPATSLLLRWRTGVYIGGREIRGRTNIARLDEAAATAGVVTAANLAAWQARQDALISSLTCQHVIYSPKNGLWANSLSGTPWNQFAVLRSRRD